MAKFYLNVQLVSAHSEHFSTDLWSYAQSCENKLYEWKERKSQYWQLYDTVKRIKRPENPYAPKENPYPHGFEE
jgi:hypothetical protein